MGTKILRTVRRYLTLLSQDPRMSDPTHAINVMNNDFEGNPHPAVIHALQQVIHQCSGKDSSHSHEEFVTADN
jgi:hypothetical protein